MFLFLLLFFGNFDLVDTETLFACRFNHIQTEIAACPRLELRIGFDPAHAVVLIHYLLPALGVSGNLNSVGLSVGAVPANHYATNSFFLAQIELNPFLLHWTSDC